MINSIKNKLSIFYLFLFFFFMLDICLFALYGQPLTYFLVCLYLAQLMQPSHTLMPCVSIASGTCLQYFLYFGITDTFILYLAPVALGLIQMRNSIYLNKMTRIGLSWLLLLLHCVVIDLFIIGYMQSYHYTILKTSVTIIIIEIFIHKLKKHDSQDNRCLPLS